MPDCVCDTKSNYIVMNTNKKYTQPIQTNTLTDIMSNMVTQTQTSMEVNNQIKDKMVPAVHGGKPDRIKLSVPVVAKVLGNKPMIQLTLDGRKALIKQNQKTITVKRHYRKRTTTDIKLKRRNQKPSGEKDPAYQLSLKLLSKIRFDELMELRNRVFKK